MKKDNPHFQKAETIRIFVLLSLILLVVGSFAEVTVMRIFAIALIILTLAALYMTWVPPTYVGTRTALIDFAIATSYAVLAIGIFGGLIFVVDSFITSIANMNFAVFGSIFVSIMVSRVYLGYQLAEKI